MKTSLNAVSLYAEDPAACGRLLQQHGQRTWQRRGALRTAGRQRATGSGGSVKRCQRAASGEKAKS